MHNLKVLIVEDELIAAEFLRETLKAEGIEVVGVVDTGPDAIETCLEHQPDAVFMDIMLRGAMSGSEAAVAISRQCDAKIIFLTAYTDPEMVDYAVEARAAGYLTKPYNEAQIVATLRLAMARENSASKTAEPAAPKTPEPMVHLVGGLVFDMKLKRLMKGEQEVPLSPKPLRMIELLCRYPNVSVSNEQIAMHVWGELVNDKTLRTLIYRIRSMTHEGLIKNVSGTGYMIRTEA